MHFVAQPPRAINTSTTRTTIALATSAAIEDIERRFPEISGARSGVAADWRQVER